MGITLFELILQPLNQTHNHFTLWPNKMVALNVSIFSPIYRLQKHEKYPACKELIVIYRTRWALHFLGNVLYCWTYTIARADPESFVRGGPTLKKFLEGREYPNKYHYKRAIIDPPAKRNLNGHLNGVLLVGRWWPNIECWIGSFVIVRGSGQVLLRDTMFFVIFQGMGVRTPCHPSGSEHELHARQTDSRRTCTEGYTGCI